MSPRKTPNADTIQELEQYRRLLDNIPAEIGIFDTDGRFLFNTPSGIKDAAVRQWVIGKTHHEYCRERGYPMEIANRRQEVIERCVAQREVVSFQEIWLDRSNRRRYYVRTFSPVMGPDDSVTHVIGYGQEITELKKAEDALRDAHAELQEEVKVRMETAEKLRHALSEVEHLRDRLQADNQYLQEEIKTHHNFEEIIGTSTGIDNVIEAINMVAPTDANVLIVGETGTGKELVARAIHAASRRKDKPLIKVNCGSIPHELFESEFFGHVKGAFTGAVRDRAGRFELADGGTLFLDEIGEIPLAMQSKLLRVLQDGEYERIGQERTRKVDVRVLAATNRDLKQEVDAGTFRRDLYYRLNVFPVEVIPLRHRRQDIAALASHFLETAVRRLNSPTSPLTEGHVRELQAYDWPGNVRELQNVIERAVIRSRGRTLRFDLPDAVEVEASSREKGRSGEHHEGTVIPEVEMRQRERDNIRSALAQTNWKIYGTDGAAELLGVKPTTLASRIKKLGLRVEAQIQA